jgi:putative Holliday junction resolvase
MAVPGDTFLVARIPDRGRVLGVDLGARRVGIAVCDTDRRLATPATTLHRGGGRQEEHRLLRELVEEYEAVGVVVGQPLSLTGEQGPAARAAGAEVVELRRDLGVPVETVDERLTTVSATAALRRGGRTARQQRQVVDQVAAAVLLQAWLDRADRVPQ